MITQKNLHTVIPIILSSTKATDLLKLEHLLSDCINHRLTPAMYGMYFNYLISTEILIKKSLDQLDYTNSDGKDLLYYVNNP